jgi:hypothetical protein
MSTLGPVGRRETDPEDGGYTVTVPALPGCVTEGETMMRNDIQGRVRKAFNFINSSTGAKVSCNRLGPGVGTEAIIDRSSRSGDQGSG